MMDEITMDELENQGALIEVAQLPVIIQHLERKGAEIRQRTAEVMTMAVSPESLADARRVRAELNKEKAELEDQRKAVKRAVMNPYEEFEAVYKKNILTPFAEADRDLAGKITEVEAGIIGACEEEMRRLFDEMVKASHLEWLKWDRMGLKITLTDAKQKTYAKVRCAVASFVNRIAADCEAISHMEDAAEIMAEYKNRLILADSVAIVCKRHELIEQEQREREAQEARRREEAERVAAVEAAMEKAPEPTLAPVVAPEPIPTPEPEKEYRCTFTVHATKEKLKHLKNFLIMEGIKYE